MNIKQATDYGFRAVLYLAQQPREAIVEAHSIAQNQVVPMRFLLKIMPSLIKAGIVRSQRGIGGGYALDRDPRDITLLDVLEAMEGPIYLNRCLVDEDLCTKQGAPDCKVHQALASIQENLNFEFRSYTIADLLD